MFDYYRIAFFRRINTKHKITFVDYFLKRMKNMLPSTFGYTEGMDTHRII
jgi:hypothetical protein